MEGEAVVLSAGVLVHKGLLPFWGVAACAAAGSFVADQLWFAAGRLARERSLVRRLRGTPPYERALGLLHRHATAFIFSFRFIYGLRTVSPVVIGTSDVAAGKFVLLNAAAAAVWGPLLTWAGYQFGKAIEPLVGDTRSAAILVGGALLIVATAYAAWRLIRTRRGASWYRCIASLAYSAMGKPLVSLQSLIR